MKAGKTAMIIQFPGNDRKPEDTVKDLEKAALAEVSDLLRTQIRRASDRDGFVPCRGTGEATRPVWEILDLARQAHAGSRPVFALDLILRALHAMVSLVNKCDDSNGHVGDAIRACLDLIREVISETAASPAIDHATRKALFSKLLTEASGQRYEGWFDWPLHLLETSTALTSDPVLYDRLESHLSGMLAARTTDSWNTDFERERIALIQHRLILQRHGPAAARTFTDAHLDFPSFREKAIETALAEQDYEAALALARDGEKTDQKYAGLVAKWNGWQHTVYERSGQVGRQRELALELLLRGDFEYYLALKRTYRPDEWTVLYPDILKRLAVDRFQGEAVYTKALIEEQDWPRLLHYTRQFPSTIESFYQYLLPHHRDEVFEVYVRFIEEEAAEAGNRKKYYNVCKHIRKLQHLGGRDEADQVIRKLREKYQNRPAMLEEMNKL